MGIRQDASPGGVSATPPLTQAWAHASSACITPGSGWDSYWTYQPVVALNSDGTVYADSSGNHYVYYIGSSTSRNHAYSQSEDETGLALTKDFVTFTKHASNPVLPFGSGTYNGGPWDDTDCQIGAVIVHSGTFYAFYCGNNSPGPASDFVRLGVASSSDGVTWTKYASNPVLSQGALGTGDFSDLYTGSAVMYDSGTWRWYYMGYGTGGIGGMMATASSPTGTWTKYSTSHLSGLEPNGTTFWPGPTRVWKTGGVYYMVCDDWYNLTNSYVYCSTDAVTWTRVSGSVFGTTGSGWDAGGQYGTFPFQRVAGGPWTLMYNGWRDTTPGTARVFEIGCKVI